MIQQTILTGLGFAGMAVGNIPSREEKVAAAQKGYELTNQYATLQKEALDENYKGEKDYLEQQAQIGKNNPKFAAKVARDQKIVDQKYKNNVSKIDLAVAAQRGRVMTEIAAYQRDTVVKKQLKEAKKEEKAAQRQFNKAEKNLNKYENINKKITELEAKEEFKEANRLKKKYGGEN